MKTCKCGGEPKLWIRNDIDKDGNALPLIYRYSCEFSHLPRCDGHFEIRSHLTKEEAQSHWDWRQEIT